MQADLYETGGVGWGENSGAFDDMGVGALDDTHCGAFDDTALSPEEAGAYIEDAGFFNFKKAFRSIGRAVKSVAKTAVNLSKPIGRIRLPKGVPLVGGASIGSLTGLAYIPQRMALAVASGKRLDRAALSAARDAAETVGVAAPVVAQVPLLKPFAPAIQAVGGAATAFGQSKDLQGILQGAGEGALQGAIGMIAPGAGQSLGQLTSFASQGLGGMASQALGGGLGGVASKGLSGLASQGLSGLAQQSLGTLINQAPTLATGAVRSVAEKLLSTPELRSLPVSALAAQLGVSPATAQAAISSAVGAAREVGELGAGALPPLRQPIPALRKLVGNLSMYAALPRVASMARRPVQTASPIHLRRRHRKRVTKRALYASSAFHRLAPQIRHLALSDASGLDAMTRKWTVEKGESAWVITEKILGKGKGNRYPELLAANPTKKTNGLKFPQLNWTSLVPGEVLSVPSTWVASVPASSTPAMPPPAATVTPAAQTVAKVASAQVMLAEWSRQYPNLGALSPTDVSPDWSARARSTMAAFQQWSGLPSTGDLDDTSYERLRAWFESNVGRGQAQAPSTTVPSTSTPAPPTIIIPVPSGSGDGGGATLPIPIPIPVVNTTPTLPTLPPVTAPGLPSGGTVSGGGAVSVQTQPADASESKSGGGGAAVALAAAAILGLALATSK